MVFMISINYRDPRPIYEQVRDALRKLIVSGSLPSDQKLPSVRELASSLAINPNTIQRAYHELEAEGFIRTMPGKGSFACARTDVDEERKSALLHQFDETVGELLYLGVSPAVLCARIRKGEEPHD